MDVAVANVAPHQWQNVLAAPRRLQEIAHPRNIVDVGQQYGDFESHRHSLGFTAVNNFFGRH
jgi:hypothetical protein